MNGKEEKMFEEKKSERSPEGALRVRDTIPGNLCQARNESKSGLLCHYR